MPGRRNRPEPMPRDPEPQQIAYTYRAAPANTTATEEVFRRTYQVVDNALIPRDEPIQWIRFDAPIQGIRIGFGELKKKNEDFTPKDDYEMDAGD